MKYIIENIGKVKSAEIELNGLTVLTGENSVGKSTIGKAIFSLVKGINNAVESYESKKLNSLSQILNAIDKYLIDDLGLNGEVRDFFQPSTILLDLKKIEGINNNYSSEISDHLIAFEYILRLEQDILEKVKAKRSAEKGNQIVNLFNQIKGVITNSRFNNIIFNKGVNDTLNDVLNGEITNRFAKSPTKIEFYNANKKINSFEVNSITNATFLGEFPKSIDDSIGLIFDATIVETPLILSLSKFIKNNLAFNRTNINDGNSFQGLPFQTFDLLKKLSQNNIRYQEKLSDKITNIIGGIMSYDEGRNDFVYEDKQKNKFNVGNVASGIKSFGLLQILASTGNLHKKSLLILDEPEVHLHPFWQLEYAKLIVNLVKNGIPILLSSHSPYFIEALKTYSDSLIPDRTKFYLGKESENGSIFEDVTSNMEELFNLFAQPMQKLVWI